MAEIVLQAVLLRAASLSELNGQRFLKQTIYAVRFGMWNRARS
ncbi:MAG: hypothetical protein ACK5NT_06595 [Pyrinomonadaceae bacterium]